MHGRSCFFTIILEALLFAGIASAQEDYTTWSQHKMIFLNTSATGANVPNNVYNFAILIRLDPSNFSGFSQALLQGADIRFSKGNYSVHLPYQIERWVDGTGYNDTAVIWVLLDTVLGNSTSQAIVMHYGKTGATSQSNGPSVFTAAGHYKATLHLCEGTTKGAQAAFVDASGNGNNGDDSCTNPASAGIIGLGQSFGGGAYGSLNDFIAIRKVGTTFNSNFNNNAQWTMSMWVNLSSSNGGGCIMYKGNPTRWVSNEIEYCFGNQTDTKSNGLYPQLVSWGHDFAWTDGSTPLSTGVWHHLVLTYADASGSAQYYLDGVALPMDPAHDGYNASNAADSNSRMWIGRPCDAATNDESNAYFQGSMDEFELSDTVRTADWVNLSFQNQKQNQTLVSMTPPPPVLSSPTNGAGIPMPVSLAWYSTPTAISYGVQVSTSPAFSTTVLNQTGVTVDSLPVSGLTVNTTYFWKANATDGVTTTAWSSVWSFMPVMVPAVPALVSPTNNASSQLISPTLAWGSVVSAVSYGFQLSTSSTFSSTVMVQTGITGTMANVSGLGYTTTYFWCVNASNAVGNSAWSGIWSFTTSIAPPAMPALNSPADGSSNIPVNNVTISWSSVAGATAYTLQVASMYGFSTTLINLTGLTTTSSVISGLSTSATYFWRVAGTNAGGMGTWSYIWRFSTVSVVSTLPKCSMAGKIAFSVKSGMIAYSLPRASAIEISFHDILGRAIVTIKRNQGRGRYVLAFKDLDLAAGCYIVRFKTVGFERRAWITITR